MDALSVMADEEAGPRAVGAAIGRARRAARLSQLAVARRAGISDKTLAQIEGGGAMIRGQWVVANPRAENLAAVARAVGMPVEEAFRLAGREDELDLIDTSAPVVEQHLEGLPDGLRALVLNAKDLPDWRLKELVDLATFFRNQEVHGPSGDDA